MKHPSIKVGEREFFQVACKHCQEAHNFTIFYDAKDFILHCRCGSVTEVKDFNVQDRPDERLFLFGV